MLEDAEETLTLSASNLHGGICIAFQKLFEHTSVLKSNKCPASVLSIPKGGTIANYRALHEAEGCKQLLQVTVVTP